MKKLTAFNLYERAGERGYHDAPESQPGRGVEVYLASDVDARIAELEARQPEQQSEPTFRVQCRCGWQGTTDQLLVAAAPVGERCCPKCQASFKRLHPNQSERPE